jgi:GNAT superfamily N-acetyltransferase
MSQNHKRWMMRHTLLIPQPTVSPWNFHPIISQQDALRLGQLMYDAYHGTIDDEGETPEEARTEIAATLAGKYGPLLTTSSFLIEIEEQGRALAASVLTDWTNERTGTKHPLLAFLMTHPDAAGKGMATALLQKSINALRAHGQKDLVLFVTVGNSRAQHIYQKLGFQIEEEFETNRIKSE